MSDEEQKHTPGPWIMEHDEGQGTVTIWAGSAIQDRHSGLYDYAGEMEIYSSVYFDGDSTESDEECLANARLIAAAPELLEALEDALKYGEFEKHPFRPWHDKARDAIIKATGKEAA